jgi:hypothetical protein
MQELIDYRTIFSLEMLRKSKLKNLRKFWGLLFGIVDGVDFQYPQLELNSNSIEKT